MDRAPERSSRVSLALSLVLHALLIAPVWGWLVRGEPAVNASAVDPESQPIEFTFVDPQPVVPVEPETPTPLLSTQDQRAAQPEAPSDLPAGEAYQTGRTPVPVTPRVPGASTEAADERQSAEMARPEGRDRPRTDEGPRTASGDARLAMRESPLNLPPRRQPSATGSRLPAPEVDRRLTRATAGSAFSLNTTEWEWGPYIARLKARIEAQIFPPPAFYYGTAAWATRVRFRIAPDGRLERVELLDHRGVPNLQYVATAAVEGAADYEPLPPGFPEDHLEITGNFYFNVTPPAR